MCLCEGSRWVGKWSAQERAGNTHPILSWECWMACLGRTAWCPPGSGGRWWGCTSGRGPGAAPGWPGRGTGDQRGRHPDTGTSWLVWSANNRTSLALMTNYGKMQADDMTLVTPWLARGHGAGLCDVWRDETWHGETDFYVPSSIIQTSRAMFNHSRTWLLIQPYGVVNFKM